ncbi:MAG: dihydrofolate reductase family protein [Ruminococcus sp.]|nr:dihydrofolate reductase family protein [Ruminococcus sp.]
MNRPHIICHMTTSIDGKVTGDFLSRPECESATESYYQINRDYHADAFACGRVTMEESFTHGYQPDLSGFADVVIQREDYIADKDAGFFAVAFDRHGRLGWQTAKIIDDDPGYDNAHIIEVLCEDALDAYLAYLQSIGVSYIFAGKEELNLSLALDKLYRVFGIKKLLLEGGSIINGAFERENVIDELSLVVAPIIAGTEGKPLFYESEIQDYTLTETKLLTNSAVWLHYLKN